MKDFSYLTQASPEFLDNLYNEFLSNPSAIDPDWKKFFEGFDFAIGKQTNNGNDAIGIAKLDDGQLQKEFNVFRLIRSYRKRGHLLAKTNPIKDRKDRNAQLALSNFGLTDNDLNTPFYVGNYLNLGTITLQAILDYLQKVYGSDIGIEYTYINNIEKCKWVEDAFEKLQTDTVSIETKKQILEKLNAGVIFEKFLHTKYIGQKRFSLEGGESTIPALDTLIHAAAENGAQEVIIGMAHRGRLNVLANILGKTYEQIFSEFEGNMPQDSTMGNGDVKYHLGFRSTITTRGGKEINVQLTPNPSHLEVVAPIVAGFARAKTDLIYENNYDKILPIIIHGDAAVAGQGVVYELLQMSKLEGYKCGGTIHFIINNQIGFTTDFDDARSGDYCTSIASMVQAPVLHINGDDPEAVVKAALLAVQYRQQYHEDIFIDMVCYRRHGHNEGDDPSFTQPTMYELIKQHANPREIYNQQLIARGDVDAALAQEMETAYWKNLQDRLDEIKEKPLAYSLQPSEKDWSELRHALAEDFENSPTTAIKKEVLEQLFKAIMQIPNSFSPLPKIKKLLDDKVKLYETEQKLDWATGELLAYASLVNESKSVRMTGQDVQRGTFSHRHAVLHDENTNEKYNRISSSAATNTKFEIYNSLLSEFAVLGFEYGYSIADPHGLTIWEAQFGDFANGCQTVIDQYIATAETKWQKMSGLIMLLPHGYEGQGPEHSSARLERFLQNCAENNLVITNITTAANLFHAIRRQLTWEFRKPLINFSPKANLRHIRAYSPIVDFTEGKFQEVIDDSLIKATEKVRKVLLCSGKIYFDLSEKQINENITDIAIVRLEQIHPLPINQLAELRKKYNNAKWIWVQEEPKNMGAVSFLKMNWEADFDVISRPQRAATATGYSKKHAIEQKALIDEAFI